MDKNNYKLEVKVGIKRHDNTKEIVYVSFYEFTEDNTWMKKVISELDTCKWGITTKEFLKKHTSKNFYKDFYHGPVSFKREKKYKINVSSKTEDNLLRMGNYFYRPANLKNVYIELYVEKYDKYLEVKHVR